MEQRINKQSTESRVQNPESNPPSAAIRHPIRPGLSCLLEERSDILKGRSIGLITNITGVDEKERRNIDILWARDDWKLTALFSPEHGLKSDVLDGIPVDSAFDPSKRLPVYSLYGDHKQPTPEMLSGIDLLIFDIQDIGVRYYTYITTLGLAMEAAAREGIPFVVCDRPNPITGKRVEGNILDLKFRSFVGYYPLPIRYGMSIGELALLFNQKYEIGAELEVVKVEGWKREMWFDETSLPWIPPSPDMPGLNTAILYPGTCLFEGTNVSEGRGTSTPFELIGAPWLDGKRLAEGLNSLALPGVRFRPAFFRPTRSKYTEVNCSGVKIVVLDRESIDSIRTGLNILALIKKDYETKFSWSKREGTYFFDRLIGTDQVRQQLEAGCPVETIMAFWLDEKSRFLMTRRTYLLYD
ncbi:MAG: DUF1343 domain-containing protein [bacterium]